MNEANAYKLIQAVVVDSSKKKVLIRDRFTKLTLSNKKTPPKNDQGKEVNNSELVRRSLLGEFNVNNVDENPIFRSNSLSNEEVDVPPIEATQLHTEEFSDCMEPLHLTDDGVDDILTQKISRLTLDNCNDSKMMAGINSPNKQDHTISILSTETDGDDAITVSSGTASERWPSNCDMVTSDIPLTGETADQLLPATLSNTAADRIDAFLRDVSQQLKSTNTNTPTSVDIPTASADISKGNSDIVRAMEIANADTEPITSMENDNSPVGDFGGDSNDTDPSKSDCDSMRHADNDTEPNTLITSTKTESPHSVQLLNSSNISAQQRSVLCDDSSLTIPETSSESELDEIVVKGRPPPGRKEHLVGTINISAKINIKIQLSAMSSNSGSDESNNSSGSSSRNSKRNKDNSQCVEQSPAVATSANAHAAKATCNKHLQRDATAAEAAGSAKADADAAATFLTPASKILNELYGKTWQTPELIRILQRTTKTDGGPKGSTQKCTPRASSKKKEIAVDEFSVFRRHVTTNLESTRLAVPDRSTARPRRGEQSKQKDKPPAKATPRLGGSAVAQRWRQLVDDGSDAQENNASDDSDLNMTANDENASDDRDKSWNQDSSDCEDEEDSPRITRKASTKQRGARKGDRDRNATKVVYLDLSKEEVTVLEGTPDTTLADDDEALKTRLADILRTCKREPKLKIGETPCKTKRKLFHMNFDVYGDNVEEAAMPQSDTPRRNLRTCNYNDDQVILDDAANVDENVIPASFRIFNKRVNAAKMNGEPIFPLTPSKVKATPPPNHKNLVLTGKNGTNDATPKSRKQKSGAAILDQLCLTPNFKYGFLKSLDVCVGKSRCHPEALVYRDSYRTKREELADVLYQLYNSKLFENNLNVPIVWNKKLLNTAGRCLNKRKLGERSCIVELSEKVLTSADRLRCTLVHELCHAATWIFNGEGGHGNVWKSWARKANSVFPELPKIGVCHQYEIEFKYTYKCTLCNAKSHAHSKSRKVADIRCSYCHGAIEIFLNKRDKDGNVLPTPVREPTGFAKFVKDNYKQYKHPNMKHADVMKILSNRFATLKVSTNDGLDG